MIIAREIAGRLKKLAQQFPIVALVGPRQSGKTTLAKETFSEYAYVTLEDIDIRFRAKNDPRLFLASFDTEAGVIIDEVQEVPELFSYLQGIVDSKKRPGFFILTGSQNFLLYEKISQSLAGRISLLTLLPLTVAELQHAKKLSSPLEEILFKGFYPRLHATKIDTYEWFAGYISAYVERDVRQVLQIGDILKFQRFIKLCAARSGNLVNYAELARDADISLNTAKAWISVLETSYIITLLQPYHKNLNKRVIKTPKLFFYDTGLVCALLGIRSPQDLFIHPIRGALFETFAISELCKYQYNRMHAPTIYFWRDVRGNEIDCILESSFEKPIPIEIKGSMTLNDNFYQHLLRWKELEKYKKLPAYLIYAGDRSYQGKDCDTVAWNKIKKIIDDNF